MLKNLPIMLNIMAMTTAITPQFVHIYDSTRQMLGASWDEPECIFELNNRFIGTYIYGINRHVSKK